MKVAPLSAKAIRDWCVEHKVPFPHSENDLHVTIIASKASFSTEGALEFTKNGKQRARIVAQLEKSAHTHTGASAVWVINGENYASNQLCLLLGSP